MIANEWARSKKTFEQIQESIEILFDEIDKKDISKTLSKELLLGAVFSGMVRNESQ